MKEATDWELVFPESSETVVVTEWASYTQIAVSTSYCSRCGQQVEETHTITLTDKRDSTEQVGSVRVCPNCDATHWLFYTHGPHVEAARARQRKTVP